ncbi:putative histidine 2-aminobutanoyltransferase [Hollandina sp. SP2]
MTQEKIIKEGQYFLSIFRQFNNMSMKNISDYTNLEKTIDAYSSFVSCEMNEKIWESMEYNADVIKLKRELREESVFCLQNFEKYKAIELQENKYNISNYFKDMENCIEAELGYLDITSSSKIMFIGTGSFPTSILLIAKKSSAEVVGLDIDPEAVRLARMVVSILGNTERITITDHSVDQLEFTKTATHIILASTVKSKFDILTQLYSLTNKDVVIAIRYGNGFKSLFNYPLQDVDRSLWKLLNTVSIVKSIFDIAVYKKI